MIEPEESTQETDLSPQEEDEEASETEDSIIVDLGKEKAPKEEDSKQEQEEDQEAPEERRKQPEKPLEKDEKPKSRPAPQEDHGEERKRRFTEAELQQAEDELDEKLEEGEIDRKEYRRLQRVIDYHRRLNWEAELAQKREESERLSRAEKIALDWAEKNIPEFFDDSSGLVSEAEQFLRDVLGAKKTGGSYEISEKVAKILGAMLVKGSSQPAERSSGSRDELRKREISSKQPARTISRDAQTDREPQVSRKEREILARLGLRKEKYGLYKKFQSSLKKNA